MGKDESSSISEPQLSHLGIMGYHYSILSIQIYRHRVTRDRIVFYPFMASYIKHERKPDYSELVA
jgi:hypothetical protein